MHRDWFRVACDEPDAAREAVADAVGEVGVSGQDDIDAIAELCRDVVDGGGTFEPDPCAVHVARRTEVPAGYGVCTGTCSVCGEQFEFVALIRPYYMIEWSVPRDEDPSE